MTARVDHFLTALTTVNRPEIWIDLVDADLLRHNMSHSAGPLSGLLLAVKNNVDVAGLATTAACPAFSDSPADVDAVAVDRLRAAGASVVGTTNLDQFATGLVGQRSPHGGVRDARRPTHISGGSSSGSAVAVALGLADIAVATDTAGSGRVPAALQGIVGIKPTLGLVSTKGVLPACRSWDVVTIMARDLTTANAAMSAMAGGTGTREIPATVKLAAPARPRIAIPDRLPGLSEDWRAAFTRVVDRLRASASADVHPIAFGTFLDAAHLLYGGALVAERHAAVGDFVDTHLDQVDPVVGQIISQAGSIPASNMATDLTRLSHLRTQSLAALDGFDALLVPTAPGHPSIADVANDPVGVNAWLGTYTQATNLFDMCGVAVPAGTVGDAQFGVSVLAPAFHDAVAYDIARLVCDLPETVAAAGAAPALPESAPWIEAGTDTVDLFVVGAHLPGQPLDHEMTSRGARFIGTSTTAPGYRLFALDTLPPKPGLVHTPGAQSRIDGGIWRMSTAALGSFLSELPAPMTLGSVEQSDGRTTVGFSVRPDAVPGCRDITEFGGWLRYLDESEPTLTR